MPRGLFVVLLAALLSSSTAALQNFGMKNPFANKKDGASVLKLQLAFRVGAGRGQGTVLGALTSICDNADVNTAEGIERLAQDSALALLRREREWIACAGSVQHFGNDDDALRSFDRECISEAAKFDRENPDRSSAPFGFPKDTVAVVSAIACCMGDREDAVGNPKMLSGDALGVKAALEELAAAGQVEGEIYGFELLWVPDDDEDVLDMDDLTTDWPELLSC